MHFLSIVLLPVTVHDISILSISDSVFSLFRSKKVPTVLYDTFFCKCNRKRVYSLYSGKDLGSLSLTVVVNSEVSFWPIAHRSMSFISVSSCSQYFGSISPVFVIAERSMSLVIFTFCTNFCHYKFLMELSYFSKLVINSFCVQVCSPVLVIVSYSSCCLLAVFFRQLCGQSPSLRCCIVVSFRSACNLSC